MQRFRYLSAPAAWLMLAAYVLGGGLIATHSHDGLTSHDGLASGELRSVALIGGHDLPDTAEHVESSTSIEIEHCAACITGRRQGALDALQPSSRLPVMVTRAVRVADGLAVSGSDAQPPAPRGPPTV